MRQIALACPLPFFSPPVRSYSAARNLDRRRRRRISLKETRKIWELGCIPGRTPSKIAKFAPHFNATLFNRVSRNTFGTISQLHHRNSWFFITQSLDFAVQKKKLFIKVSESKLLSLSLGTWLSCASLAVIRWNSVPGYITSLPQRLMAFLEQQQNTHACSPVLPQLTFHIPHDASNRYGRSNDDVRYRHYLTHILVCVYPMIRSRGPDRKLPDLLSLLVWRFCFWEIRIQRFHTGIPVGIASLDPGGLPVVQPHPSASPSIHIYPCPSPKDHS